MAERTVPQSKVDRSIAWVVVSFVVLAFFGHAYTYAPNLARSGKTDLAIAFLITGLAGAAIGIILLSVAVVLVIRAAKAKSPTAAIFYARALRVPIAITVGNVLVWLILDREFSSDVWFNLVRLIAVLWAGWALARQGASIWKSAAVGLMLMTIDHLLIKGGWLLLTGEWLAVAGVLISFAMYAVVPLAFGALGGIIARKVPPSNTTVERDAEQAARPSP